MPEFDLDAVFATGPEWEPWDPFDCIHATELQMQGGVFDWATRIRRDVHFWISSDETRLACAGKDRLRTMEQDGYIIMNFVTVPASPPNEQLLIEVTNGYNRYPQDGFEMSVAVQWMMAWAYFADLPGRTERETIQAEDFNFPL